MAWSGTIIERGVDGKTGSGTLQSDLFTPAADALMLVCMVCSGAEGGAGDMSGHDSGGAWAEIVNAEHNPGRNYKIFAAHAGPTPSEQRITVNSGYVYRQVVGFYELTGCDVAGSVLESFGTPVVSPTVYGNNIVHNISLTPFRDAESFAIGFGAGYWTNLDGFSFPSSPPWTDLPHIGVAGIQGSGNLGYHGAEDTDIDIPCILSWTTSGACAVEVRGAQAAALPSIDDVNTDDIVLDASVDNAINGGSLQNVNAVYLIDEHANELQASNLRPSPTSVLFDVDVTTMIASDLKFGTTAQLRAEFGAGAMGAGDFSGDFDS